MSQDANAEVPTILLSLRDAPPVAQQPHVRLSHWAIHEVDNALYLIGRNIDQDSSRHTSQLVQFDRHTRSAITRSGRCYQLVGDPGPDPLTLLAWQLSCRLRGETYTNVTQQLLNPQ